MPRVAEHLVGRAAEVEAHVRSLFRKLGASSRAEVARIVERAMS
jgi:DNA-binding NarL/FixJ family response regulator